jgi:WD40 repeat protein
MVVFDGDDSEGNTVKVWDAVTGIVIQTLQGNSHGVNSVFFSGVGCKIMQR